MLVSREAARFAQASISTAGRGRGPSALRMRVIQGAAPTRYAAPDNADVSP